MCNSFFRMATHYADTWQDDDILARTRARTSRTYATRILTFRERQKSFLA